MSPASRVAGQGLSPIRRMAVGAPPGAVNLALGEPGWPLPTVAREALAAAAHEDGPLPYGPNTSRADLVQAIANHHRVPAAQVMVTSGSQAALFALFQAHVEPGSTVLVPDPGFVSYPALARLCGAEPVGYPLAPGGHLDAQAVVQALEAHPHTSMVVLCHPANPTGGMASAAALRTVAEACARRGALLVSDEVYRELWVDEPPPSLLDVAWAGSGVVLGSMSKAFGAPGLRVGWAVGAPEALTEARIVHSAMTTAPAQPSQAAALALLLDAEEVLAESRRHVRARWETAARSAPGRAVEHGHARAGIYLWVPVPDDTFSTGELETDDPTLALALRLRDEAGVVTVPGSAFGPRGAGYLRVSLGGPIDDLEEGLRRLASWWMT